MAPKKSSGSKGPSYSQLNAPLGITKRPAPSGSPGGTTGGKGGGSGIKKSQVKAPLTIKKIPAPSNKPM